MTCAPFMGTTQAGGLGAAGFGLGAAAFFTVAFGLGDAEGELLGEALGDADGVTVGTTRWARVAASAIACRWVSQADTFVIAWVSVGSRRRRRSPR
ncbi:hypothetical protein ACFQY4_07510 [Catellatospora bangladeshensis]|uniref:hypothetical protein n=1 Tax=Catellatospora bangladeshensis TaxID=310355 RepID=UPI003623A2FB